MSESLMDQDRFDRLVEAYGAAPWRWPEDEREAATRFAQGSPAASERLARARALDDALDVWAVAAAPPAVRERILKAAPGWRTPAFRQPRFWWASAGLASACALGVAVGALVTPLTEGREADPVAVLATQYDGAAPFGGAFDLGAMS
jgi:anti-sigma factor RsiW